MTAHQTTLAVNIRTDYTVVDARTLLAAAQALAKKLRVPRPGSEREALRMLLLHRPRNVQQNPDDYGLHRGNTVLMTTDDDTQPGEDTPPPGLAEAVSPT